MTPHHSVGKYHDVMNLDALSQTVADLRARLAEMEGALAKIVAEIDRAKGQRDGFSVHLYRALQSWRWHIENPSKGARRQEDESRRSFMEAQEFGYVGTLRDWIALLNVRKVEREPREESPW